MLCVRCSCSRSSSSFSSRIRQNRHTASIRARRLHLLARHFRCQHPSIRSLAHAIVFVKHHSRQRKRYSTIVKTRKQSYLLRHFSRSKSKRTATAAHFPSDEADTAPKAVTDDVFTTADDSMDPINTLLRYPTLYDPIRKPRNPIILCHGLYGFSSWGLDILPALRIHYWADVLSVMKGVIGIEPIITSVPGAGSITDRAKILHQALATDLKGKSVNLIGHSMGGLDCRYLLSHIRPDDYKVLSLTTLATPHRGSQFMAWCRANIGIGEIAKAAAAAATGGSPMVSYSSSPSSPPAILPYSLKTPLLMRKQQEDAIEKAERSGENSKQSSPTSDEVKKKSNTIAQTLLNLPGLNYSLGTSVASYLLDLLDSPAYSNLTPDYLNNTFNPATPDRADVRYFSIAARSPKLGVTHPLWLPKLISDKSEEIERAEDAQNGTDRGKDWQWGNDGLVPVHSAKWGEYLGCIDNCDHWALRGGSGFTSDPKSKKSSTSAALPEQPEAENSAGSPSLVSTLSSFGWQDVNRAIGNRVDIQDNPRASSSETSSQSTNSRTESALGKIEIIPTSTSSSSKDAFATLTNIANWMVKRIPLPSSNNETLRSSINPAFPFDDSFAFPQDDPSISTSSSSSSHSYSSSPSSSQSLKAKTTSSFDNARLLFGLRSSSSAKSADSAGKRLKFDHEKFYVALCRKLYDEGL